MIFFCSDSAKNLGFTVIIDMRGNGNCSTNVKAILKVLQEHFSANIHNVVIIKPDNFWQKQRASISSHKYKFETSTISIEALNKIAEPNQLTSDFEGNQLYDHQQWTDSRLAIEDFFWQASDLADRIDDLQEDLQRNDFAEDVNGARHALDHHNEMKKKILKLPIEDLDVQGKKLLAKINMNSGCSAGAVSIKQTNIFKIIKFLHYLFLFFREQVEAIAVAVSPVLRHNPGYPLIIQTCQLQ